MSMATPTVQTNNERCIVTRWDFRPGDETGEHIHEHDYCVVPLVDGALKIVDHAGNEAVSQMRAGVSYFRKKGVHHNVINANDFDFAFVEVELK